MRTRVISPESRASSGSLRSRGRGIVTSNFFGYDAGYTVADSLRPGKGYWVNVSQAGTLVIAAGGMMPSENRIVVVPGTEFPPPPPGLTVAQRTFEVPYQFR